MPIAGKRRNARGDYASIQLGQRGRLAIGVRCVGLSLSLTGDTNPSWLDDYETTV